MSTLDADLDLLARRLGLAKIEPGQDVHRLTAMQIYGVGYDDVTPEQRRKAKTVNYYKLYFPPERRKR